MVDLKLCLITNFDRVQALIERKLFQCESPVDRTKKLSVSDTKQKDEDERNS